MERTFLHSKVAYALTLAGTLGLAACHDNSSSDSSSSNASSTTDVVVKTQAYSNANTDGLSGYSQLVYYNMPGVNGQQVMASAIVLTPKGNAPTGGWPVIVWAHGTTGVADQCAPSAEANIGGYASLIQVLLQQGYMVVAPDYEGLGTPGIHPYLNLSSEAQSIIYALKAAKTLVGTASNSWMVLGHSQGGQAALGAAQYAAEVDYQFKGTVAVAPASHLEQILQLGSSMAQQAISAGNVAQGIGILAGQNAMSALAAASIRATNPSFGYDQLFDARGLAIAPQAESICLDALGGAFAQDIQSYLQAGGSLANYSGITANFAQNTTIHNFLTSAEPGTVKINAPVLIVQGDADTTVPKVATDALVQHMQSLGTNVTYDVQSGQTHTGALSSGLTDILTFIKNQMAVN